MESDINSSDHEFHDPREDSASAEDPNDITPNDGVIKGSRRRAFLKEGLALLFIVLLVVIFRSIFFEPFKIPTGSMIPTLKIGDFILVNKFAYGFKVPFSDITIGSFSSDPVYLFGRKEIKRGDIVVFKYPKSPAVNYIKRVIGLPGETIEIRDKRVLIDGKPLDIEEVKPAKYMKTMDEKFRDNNLAFYKVKLKEKTFVYQVDKDNFFKVDFEKRKIPKGHYFVMGDNRDFSYDSRYWGVVPHKNIKGQAFLVWLSIESSTNPDKSFSLRTERIGELIR